jgi:RNA polymerase sigma-70 factor (ECF subfamily)
VARPEDERGAFSAPVPESVTLELVRRIRAGERDAWDDLYARYHDQLLLTVRLRLGQELRRHLESEDVLQNVALDAFRALPRFEYRGAGSLEAYLRTLVVNELRDRADAFSAAKRAGTVPLEGDAPARAASEPCYLDAERYERLERALRALPSDQREIVVLRRLEDLTGKEVAARLGMSDEAARKAYSRAMAHLTTLLSRQG